ncbi:MAG: nickel-responsive transcriptional regulator NikR [Candidatus Hydrothermarchaeota archaeon]
MSKVERISISIPSDLLKEFDSIMEKRGYTSRSEALRDAIRDYIADYKWISELEGNHAGSITMLFDHDQKGVLESLTELGHKYHDVIDTSIHIHLKEEDCLEVIVVRGDSRRIRELTEKMMSIKGVKHVKLTTTSVD